MTRSELIEAMARALALADLDEETAAVVNLDKHMEFVRPHYSELAEAALSAIEQAGFAVVAADRVEQVVGEAGRII